MKPPENRGQTCRIWSFLRVLSNKIPVFPTEGAIFRSTSIISVILPAQTGADYVPRASENGAVNVDCSFYDSNSSLFTRSPGLTRPGAEVTAPIYK